MKIILFGPQGAGKGTVGAMLSRKLDIPLLGTGDIFRNAIKEGTKLGKIAEQYINKGELVPDDITTKVIKERIEKEDCKEGYILDGFPRTLKQADLFHEEINDVDYLLELDAPESLLIHRLTGRRICKECGAVYNIHPDCDPNPEEDMKCDKCGGELHQREDDKEEAIKKRLETYHQKTEKILEKYKSKVKKIDATGNPDLILGRILKVIQ